MVFSQEDWDDVDVFATNNSLSMTTEIFSSRVNQILPSIEVIGEYVNDHTKIKCRCKQCGHIWSPIAGSILRNHGCPKCAAKETGKKQALSHKEFSEKLNSINPNIELLDQYEKTHKPILCKCITCGYIWKPQPSSLLHGYGCPNCAGNAPMNQSIFVERMSKINPKIEIIGQYINSNTKIMCRCRDCGYEWSTVPNSLIKGSGCRKCYFQRRRKRTTAGKE